MKGNTLYLMYEARGGACAVKQMNPGQSSNIFTTINKARCSQINSLFCAQIKSITLILTLLHYSDVSLHRGTAAYIDFQKGAIKNTLLLYVQEHQ